jgi:hypothetical protein
LREKTAAPPVHLHVGAILVPVHKDGDRVRVDPDRPCLLVGQLAPGERCQPPPDQRYEEN